MFLTQETWIQYNLLLFIVPHTYHIPTTLQVTGNSTMNQSQSHCGQKQINAKLTLSVNCKTRSLKEYIECMTLLVSGKEIVVEFAVELQLKDNKSFIFLNAKKLIPSSIDHSVW